VLESAATPGTRRATGPQRPRRGGFLRPSMINDPQRNTPVGFKIPRKLTDPLAPMSSESYSRSAMRNTAQLDRTFQALADGTRRSIVHALSDGEERSAGQLGDRFSSTQPTISRHLKVLEEAGLIQRRISGREHLFQLRPAPLREAEHWINRQQLFWEGAMTQLTRLLGEEGE
jgi:DNA-binding transcriptional ArsR family regulator